MPLDFGSSNTAGYKYSVYCSCFLTGTSFKNAVIKNETVSAITNNSDMIEFLLYPNPSTNFVNIHLEYVPDLETRILIIDSNGRTVVNNIVESSSNQIDISMFPSGLYLVEVINSQMIKKEKLLISR